MQPDWNNSNEYTELQTMRFDNQRVRKRRRQFPSRHEIHTHLSLISSKVIDNRTALRIQTLIHHEYNEKMIQLKLAEQIDCHDSSDSSASDEENYDYFVYASRGLAPRRKKHKLTKLKN